jgi:8-oxo-dGTP pyrophosphatase MutT (NUDIX family)
MKAAGASQKPRQQVAALPFRIAPRPEILLVTSRETRRWVVPKGWPIEGRSLPEAAAREAYEEAGLDGDMSPDAVGVYHYFKRKKSGAMVLCAVSVFPMAVREQRRKWPEKKQRLTRWFAYEEAAALVHEAELRDIILAFGAAYSGLSQPA